MPGTCDCAKKAAEAEKNKEAESNQQKTSPAKKTGIVQHLEGNMNSSLTFLLTLGKIENNSKIEINFDFC